jgi:flagellar hook protein FlgE
MIRSMYAAVSGLRSHQEMINVTGSNIANVNTAGFKKSNVVFQEILGQTLTGAGAPTAALGGTNPAQVGLGVRIGAIAQNLAQGAMTRTGRVLDMAIEGDGFFYVQQAGQALFTRAGAFFLDGDGRVVTAQGGLVQGWQAEADGTIDPTGPVNVLRIPFGDQAQPTATTRVEIGGNLPADAALGATVSTGLTFYDAQGVGSRAAVDFVRTAGGWDLVGDLEGTPFTFTPPTLVFDAAGELDPSAWSVTATAGPRSFTLAMSGPNETRRVTSYAGDGTITVVNQDGAPSGALMSLSIGQDGVLFGAYSNGRSRAIGRFATALFANPEGLERMNGTVFMASANSGLPQIGTMGTGGRGMLTPGALENSNVDLAEEFTDLIRGQRGFQANSRVITTSDEMLQEVVNLKR